MATENFELPRQKDDLSVLAQTRALDEYGLHSLKDVPIARFNNGQWGTCYAVYRRGDLRVAQEKQRREEAAKAAIAAEKRERELEAEHGGVEGLKRKREEWDIAARKKRELDDLAAKRAARVSAMSILMVALLAKNLSCDGTGLPATGSNLAKPQAKVGQFIRASAACCLLPGCTRNWYCSGAVRTCCVQPD
jgi:hypothetical protein